MRVILKAVCRWFDALERGWESHRTMRAIGTTLSLTFVIALAVIEMNRQGILPEPLAGIIPMNHFHAVDLALTLLLFFEVIGLVFTLARSVASSVGKQFEILCLILVRQSFKEFKAFTEPIEWLHVKAVVVNMLAVAFGALVVFVILGFYYKLQKHLPITHDSDDIWSFVALKKLIALSLFFLFAIIGTYDLWHFALGRTTLPFFETFYTILIFSDVLIVLISLRYSSTFHVVFRNSGFAVATVFLRLALTSPHQIKAALGIVSALFALGLTLAYNTFAPVMTALQEPDGRAKAEK